MVLLPCDDYIKMAQLLLIEALPVVKSVSLSEERISQEDFPERAAGSAAVLLD